MHIPHTQPFPDQHVYGYLRLSDDLVLRLVTAKDMRHYQVSGTRNFGVFRDSTLLSWRTGVQTALNVPKGDGVRTVCVCVCGRCV